MAQLPEINVVYSKGGLGRPLDGEDHISGFIFYSATLPTGFSTTDRIKQIYSVNDAESLGILLDYADETKATASYLVTAVGANADTLELKVVEPTKTVSLGVYTKVSTDTTVALVATSIAAIINAGTLTHGYTAVAATATVTITAKAGLGVYLNGGTNLTATINGTIAGTITQFAGGAYSKSSLLYYHIKEYFRLNPKGNLYVGIYAAPSTDYAEVYTIQNTAYGKIKQLAVFHDFTTAYATTQVTRLKAQVAILSTDHMPLSILFAPELSGTSNIAGIVDATLLDSEHISTVISQDGAAQGYTLFKAVGKSVSDIGAKLGAISRAKVSESIAGVDNFNMSDGIELDTPMFSNGSTYSSLSRTALNALNNKGYMFLYKQIGYVGTYNNQPYTCTLSNSDYKYIYNVRTIDKAHRLMRAAMLPFLSSTVHLNPNGTLSDGDVATFTNSCEAVLEQMSRDGEVSSPVLGTDVLIDTTQNIATTNKLIITIKLRPIGVADFIQLNIGYTVNI